MALLAEDGQRGEDGFLPEEGSLLCLTPREREAGSLYQQHGSLEAVAAALSLGLNQARQVLRSARRKEGAWEMLMSVNGAVAGYEREGERRAWTPEEDERLAALLEEHTYPETAALLGRTAASVNSRVASLKKKRIAPVLVSAAPVLVSAAPVLVSAAPAQSGDPEIELLGQIYAMLAPLPAGGARRLLDYLQERFAPAADRLGDAGE